MPREPLWSVQRARRELPPEQRFEIDRGELLVRQPPAFYRGTVAVRVGGLLQRFVEEHRLGLVTGEAGFRLEHAPDTLRAPTCPSSVKSACDASPTSTRSPRYRPIWRSRWSRLPTGPATCVRSVWVLDPRRRTLRQHTAHGTVRFYADPADVVEDPVLPGCRCTLGGLLPPHP